MSTIRPAREDEDDTLARILYNAFLPNYSVLDQGWTGHSMSSSIPYQPLPNEVLDHLQRRRLAFYCAVIRFTRMLGGPVLTVTPADSDQPAVCLCWFPPRTHLSFYVLWKSGFLYNLLSFPILGLFKFLIYEHYMGSLWHRCLDPLKLRKEDGAFVMIIGTDPAQTGHGYARKLLEWQLGQHRKQFPGVPVFLDTAKDYTQRLYESLGFTKLGEYMYGVEVDGQGQKREHVARVMALDLASRPKAD